MKLYHVKAQETNIATTSVCLKHPDYFKFIVWNPINSPVKSHAPAIS